MFWKEIKTDWLLRKSRNKILQQHSKKHSKNTVVQNFSYYDELPNFWDMRYILWVSGFFRRLYVLSYPYTVDTLGQPTITACNDNCFCKCCPSYVRPQSKSSKTKQISSENNVHYWQDCASSWVDHWWHLSCFFFIRVFKFHSQTTRMAFQSSSFWHKIGEKKTKNGNIDKQDWNSVHPSIKEK